MEDESDGIWIDSSFIHSRRAMFQSKFEMRMAGRIREILPAHTPVEAARLALGRIHKLLTAWKLGLVLDPVRLQSLLATPLDAPVLEVERYFSLAWLAWVTDDPARAVELFTEAFNRCSSDSTSDWYSLCAYWRSRVRLLLQQPEAIRDYETLLRSLKSSPQATAWYVDLLWRGGRVDRAEQVWKSVRANKKVLSCDEGPLLEARLLLRRGELAPAEKVLTEAVPRNGVVQVERSLLLAWIATTQKQPEKASGWLEQADKGFYPSRARERWRKLLEWRSLATEVLDVAELESPLLHDLARGQQARREGNSDEAIAALQQARGNPVVEPFARYALACLGKDDPSAILSGQPGLFLAVRCRVRQTLERFRTRQASPADLLDVLHSAGATHFSDPVADHFRQLAQLLQRREPSREELQTTLMTAPADEVQRRNLFRAILELAVRRLPAATQRELLFEWARLPWLERESELRTLLARTMLRLALQQGSTDGLERILQSEVLSTESSVSGGQYPPLALLQAVSALATETTPPGWCEEVFRVRETGRWKGLAQALLLQEAARRSDVPAVAALLEVVECWRGFRQPPRFVLRTLVWLVSRNPGHPAWKRSLPGWLHLWDPAALGAEGETLAAQVGISLGLTAQAAPPPGVPAVPWFLYLAVRALTRRIPTIRGRESQETEEDDPIEALAYVRRALAVDPHLTGLPEANLVRETLLELERRALARSFSLLFKSDSNRAPVPAGLLVDAVDLLRSFPAGKALLEELQQDGTERVRQHLHDLLQDPAIPQRLLHHLALLELRTAQEQEEAEQTEQAEPSWRRAWEGFLRWLSDLDKAGITEEDRSLLLDWLLGLHRGHINDLLARGEVDRARRHWNLVQELPERTRSLREDLGNDLGQRLGRFRDDLASEYLVATREAMRYGTIPEGMRSDYEKGLTALRRLLSLDRESVRLLTALVEVCGEYFLDLYHAGSPPTLTEQVERFTPFALQLVRLIEDQPGALAARAALAEFYKFRGFISRDREQKQHHYREALRFDPANQNVRQLLDDMAAPDEEDRS